MGGKLLASLNGRSGLGCAGGARSSERDHTVDGREVPVPTVGGGRDSAAPFPLVAGKRGMSWRDVGSV